jgi:hypothetical protein
MFAYVCNGYTRVFKFFLVFCKYFMFRIYVASVLFGCCKNKSGVAHVAIRMRSEGARAVPARGLATRAPRGHTNASSGRGVLARAWETECSAGIRPDVRALAPPKFQWWDP